jgi:hypothetical protein
MVVAELGKFFGNLGGLLPPLSTFQVRMRRGSAAAGLTSTTRIAKVKAAEFPVTAASTFRFSAIGRRGMTGTRCGARPGVGAKS